MKNIFYAPILILSALILMFRFLYVAKFLNPEQYATYSFIILISSTYTIFSTFGIQSVLQRDMPILFYNKRNIHANTLLMKSLIVNLFVFSIFTIISLLIFLLSNSHQEIIFGILHGFTQQLFLLLSTESRSKLELNRLSFQNLSRAISVLIINTLIVNLSTSPYILILCESIVSIALSVYIYLKIYNGRLYKYWLISIKTIQNLPWKSGFLFMLIAIISFSSANLDRWIASIYLSKLDFGIYSFYWNIITIASSLQVIVNTALYPYMSKKYVQFGSLYILKLTLYISIGLASLLFFTSDILIYLLEIIISHFFSLYASNTDIIIIFIFSSIFIFSNYLSSFLFVIGKEGYVFYIAIITMTLNMIFVLTSQLQLFNYEINLEFLAYLNLSISITIYAATLLVCSKQAKNKIA